MIEAIYYTIGLTFVLSVIIILSLALTAPAEPEEQTPFTQAIIDQVQK